MKVKHAMHRQVEWRAPTTTVAELAQVMQSADIGAIPIGENDRLVGMVTDRDLALRAFTKERDPSKLTARDVMTKGIQYCREDDDIGEAIERMREWKVRRLPVMNAERRMVGMLSLGDVSAAAADDTTVRLFQSVTAHH